MRRARLLFGIALLGCMPNPYAKFYQGAPDARVRPDYEASNAPLAIYSSNDFNRDVLELMRRGYTLVGQSSFNAGMNAVKESQLRSQADQIGAQVVLVASQYTHTVSGAIPLSVPTTTTTTTTATATVVGSGGSATGYGTGTSTTYGNQTVILPYTVARGDFAALYFVRVRSRLGLFVVALDDSTRRRIQSNFGVRVFVVVNGSPAFNADIIPGDIVTQFAGERVRSLEHFGQLLDASQGKTIEIVLDRSGREVRKTVTLLSLARP